jgi:hypothetical protein
MLNIDPTLEAACCLCNISVYVVMKGIKGYYHLPVKGVERIPNHRQWDSFGKLIIDHAPILNYLDCFRN